LFNQCLRRTVTEFGAGVLPIRKDQVDLPAATLADKTMADFSSGLRHGLERYLGPHDCNPCHPGCAIAVSSLWLSLRGAQYPEGAPASRRHVGDLPFACLAEPPAADRTQSLPVSGMAGSRQLCASVNGAAGKITSLDHTSEFDDRQKLDLVPSATSVGNLRTLEGRSSSPGHAP
jgi:hypothetical protein